MGRGRYDTMLTNDDAQLFLNYFDGLNVREEREARFGDAIVARDKNMLRSEHMPFNFFAPLNTNQDSGRTRGRC